MLHDGPTLLFEGRYADADQLYRSASAALEVPDLNNWVYALLETEQLHLALQKARESAARTPGCESSEMLGTLEWLRGNRAAAVADWRGSFKRKYTPTGCDLDCAALLFYASVRTHDAELRKFSLSKLKKVWKPALAGAWPHSIAGFLLDQVSPTELLTEPTMGPRMDERRRCRAWFWQGVRLLVQQNGREAAECFRKSEAVGGASILEVERYLARGEIQSARET